MEDILNQTQKEIAPESIPKETISEQCPYSGLVRDGVYRSFRWLEENDKVFCKNVLKELRTESNYYIHRYLSSNKQSPFSKKNLDKIIPIGECRDQTFENALKFQHDYCTKLISRHVSFELLPFKKWLIRQGISGVMKPTFKKKPKKQAR